MSNIRKSIKNHIPTTRWIEIFNGIYWCKKFRRDKQKAKFVKITKAGFYESMVHSVEMTQKTINYKL